MLNFSNKWPKTTNLQLSQKSFKPCFRKLTIILPFIPFNQSFLNLFFQNYRQYGDRWKWRPGLTTETTPKSVTMHALSLGRRSRWWTLPPYLQSLHLAATSSCSPSLRTGWRWRSSRPGGSVSPPPSPKMASPDATRSRGRGPENASV